MCEIPLDADYISELEAEHREWLSSYASRHLANWDRLRKGNHEAACCEAAFRRQLIFLGATVQPNEVLRADGSGPDFRCSSNGSHLYVEVTCVLRSTATQKSGIMDGSTGWAPLNPFGMIDAIFSECTNKASQRRNMDAPTIVAVGTFHANAARICFERLTVASVLTGKTKMSLDIDLGTGEQDGATFEVTGLEKAAFLKPDSQEEVGFARCSISGVVLCGLGISRCLVVLHPNPAKPFDPALLPGIDFGSVVIDRITGQLRVSWTGGGGDD
jgi:hypothetical protein